MTFDRLMRSADALSDALAPMRFSNPVTHVYNPLVYAREGYAAYLRLAGDTPKRAIFLGMNPGPWGMAQTGVPFGQVEWARDWLGIHVAVGKPEVEHPKRLITGFECGRKEVSGSRLWGAIAKHFGTPEAFFERYLILNYCPLVFMEESGRNRTPDKLPASERKALFDACDLHLREVVDVLQPEWIVGIGAFAEERARLALEGTGVKTGRIIHPSPANPLTNQGWEPIVERELTALGLCPLR
ncbi:Uracil DNA glycosylase superfamily protein [compost metagenome]